MTTEVAHKTRVIRRSRMKPLRKPPQPAAAILTVERQYLKLDFAIKRCAVEARSATT